MAAGEFSREQQLRMQAELQSLRSTLANLREREASYIDASANIPNLFSNQVDDIRRQIATIENQLAATKNEKTAETIGRQAYEDAFRAELDGEFKLALKRYKNAARYSHYDASQAIRSVRYKIKARQKATGRLWMPAAVTRRHANSRLLLWSVVAVMVILMVVFIVSSLVSTGTQPVDTVKATITATATLTPAIVQLIIPNTPTPVSTYTPTSTPVAGTPPANTPLPTQTKAVLVASNFEPTVPPTPTPVPTLKPAPQIIGPKDGVVWNDGAVVFEFEPRNLAADELYCLNTMRGYDNANNENWSYRPVGNHSPRIAIEANVFRVAKIQGMQCVVWSAAIGKGSCDNIISGSTIDRVIGLPRPCDF